MSTLADLLHDRTALTPADIDWLHRLVAEWQLVSDMSFADLVLWVRTRDGCWLAAAHMRPTTGPTVYPYDVVGTELRGEPARRLERAPPATQAVAADASGRLPVGQQTVPVLRGRTVVAVLSRDQQLIAGRIPSQLELAYLGSAGELLQMISEGTFPYPGHGADPESAPRVGDGLLRLDRTGHVVYASPNALSAYRRLGVSGDLLGAHLGHTVATLSAGQGLDEPRGSAALAAALRFGEPRESEVEAQGATVLLRAMPLVPAGEPRGALVLVRDVTELRRRDRQIVGKDATIREIHHRVKNNLQIVASLLNLQASRIRQPEARAEFQSARDRVRALATLHRHLYAHGEIHTINMREFLVELCGQLFQAMGEAPGRRLHLHIEAPELKMSSDQAVPLALIVTEAVSNAVKYAFPLERSGNVWVCLATDGETAELNVRDDGVGIPAGRVETEAGTRDGIGLQLIRGFSRQLGATLEVKEGGGTQYVVRLRLRKERIDGPVLRGAAARSNR